MGKFVVTTKEDIAELVNKRTGDVKLGDTVQTVTTEDWEYELQKTTAKFVLLGIPENIGTRADGRADDTSGFWDIAIKILLNLQDTKAFPGDSLMLLGAFDFTGRMALADEADIDGLRGLTEYVDNAVYPFIQKIAEAGKVPIVIGGGHNNCYPILKGISEARNAAVNCINLDAFSDFNAMEGRHGGNGFRYAHRQGYLNKYAVVGLHEGLNSRELMDEFMDDPDLCYSYYEDVFVREKLSFYEAANFAMARTGRPCGLEIDLRCIEGIAPETVPCGIAALLARQFITWCTKELNPLYLHIAEGTAQHPPNTAHLTAHLIADFIKAYKKK